MSKYSGESANQAYTFQIIGQKSTDPTVAAIILSMESLFAVISGAIFLGETMTIKEIIGCVLMLVAVIITQIKSEDNIQDINFQDNNKLN